MKYLKLLLLIFISEQISAQHVSLLGSTAPDLTFSNIRNYKDNQSKLSDFKSKVVILDFWATWCAPCIESLPHLENLQKKFSNDVVVLTITNDSKETIDRFLAKKKLSLPIVIDLDNKLARAFPHRSIPHTIVIDKKGTVVAVTSPSELTEERLTSIAAGKHVDIPEKKDVMNFDASKPLSANDNFTWQVMITPYQEGFPSMSAPRGDGVYKGRRILCVNLSPKTLYEVAYRFPTGIRTIVDIKDGTALEWSKGTAICMDLIVPQEFGDNRFELMKQQLNFIFPYKPVIEKRKMKVKVLKVVKGETPAMTPGTGGEMQVTYSGRGLSMKNTESKMIAEFLASQLDVPVVDELGLPGLYDVELNWDNADPNQIYAELKKLGLELTDDTRELDALVIYDK